MQFQEQVLYVPVLNYLDSTGKYPLVVLNHFQVCFLVSVNLFASSFVLCVSLLNSSLWIAAAPTNESEVDLLITLVAVLGEGFLQWIMWACAGVPLVLNCVKHCKDSWVCYVSQSVFFVHELNYELMCNCGLSSLFHSETLIRNIVCVNCNYPNCAKWCRCVLKSGSEGVPLTTVWLGAVGKVLV